jgi:hypothetical protein
VPILDPANKEAPKSTALCDIYLRESLLFPESAEAHTEQHSVIRNEFIVTLDHGVLDGPLRARRPL